MKRLLFMLLISATLLYGCGSKEEATQTEGTEVAAEEATEGTSLVADIESIQEEDAEEVSEEEDMEAEEVEDEFVPNEESQKNLEMFAEQAKEKEEAREHLGEVLTTQDYKYKNGTLTLSVEKDKSTGKMKAKFKYKTNSNDEYGAAYNAITKFAEALLDNNYETEAELIHGSDTYKVVYKSKSNITYSSNVGGKAGSSKSDMPAFKEYDAYEGAQKELFTNIMRDAFTFLQLV